MHVTSLTPARKLGWIPLLAFAAALMVATGVAALAAQGDSPSSGQMRSPSLSSILLPADL